MEDKFQQLYDYMNTAGLIQEGVTPESFKDMYVSGDKNISDLFQVMSIRETPFEVGNLNEFSEGFFGVKKKKKLNQPPPSKNHSRSILRFDLLRLLPHVQLKWANKRLEVRVSL